MTVLRRLSVLLLALCCCACSTGDAADVPQATPIPTPQVLEGLRRNEEGIPLLDVYLHEEETIRSMDIERYVCGVLAGEMRNDWPLEALKAQAILARTFVLKFVSEKESRYEGADISTDITEAQAYNAAEINERIEQAVAETCGQVLLTASGELPYAWFHAHSGGKTALAREGLGWNDPEPTYTRVTDGLDSPDAPAEAAAWNAVFPVKQFLRACRATGADTETAEEVAIGEKGESGRAVTLLVDGVSVPAAELRLALGSTVMRSTLLTELSSDGAYVRMAEAMAMAWGCRNGAPTPWPRTAWPGRKLPFSILTACMWQGCGTCLFPAKRLFCPTILCPLRENPCACTIACV